MFIILFPVDLGYLGTIIKWFALATLPLTIILWIGILFSSGTNYDHNDYRVGVSAEQKAREKQIQEQEDKKVEKQVESTLVGGILLLIFVPSVILFPRIKKGLNKYPFFSIFLGFVLVGLYIIWMVYLFCH